MLALNYPLNVSRLIFRGFLTLDVRVRAQRVMLKTLNENEQDDISLWSGVSESDVREAVGGERVILFRRRLPWVLAYSLAAIDAQNVLLLRRESGWQHRLVDTLTRWHPLMLDRLALAIHDLSRWYHYETLNVERYCVEPQTRAGWYSYRGRALNDPAITGWPGTELLGLNYHQVLYAAALAWWEAQAQFDRQWALTKVLVAAENPKAAQQLEANDRSRRMGEELRERELLEGRVVGRSREEVYSDLEAEVLRQVRGEFDDHDLEVRSVELDEKQRLLREALAQSMYVLMFSRRSNRHDAVVIGRRRREGPELPLGEYAPTDAQARLRGLVEKLNLAGPAAALVVDAADEPIWIEEAAQAARKLHLERTSSAPVQSREAHESIETHH